MRVLKGVAVGAGYFSQFHYEAWARISDACIAAVCDLDPVQAERVRSQFGFPTGYTDFVEMFDRERPDFVDIITPPATHLDLVAAAAERGIAVICQKPLAPDFETAERIVATAQDAGIRFMVHENFRFQPWHREIKRMLEAGTVGSRLHTLAWRMRQGDGWGKDAYLARQPYFRTMPRMLVHETGIHHIDTFRYLGGEIAAVYARLKKWNPVIAGEDAGMLLFEFETGALGLWDANRYNESQYANPRYTFGEFLVEADGGSIRLRGDGTLTMQPLGEREREVAYGHADWGFAGDCVYPTQAHFVARLIDGQPFETDGAEYLKSLRVEEAAYASAESGARVALVQS